MEVAGQPQCLSGDCLKRITTTFFFQAGFKFVSFALDSDNTAVATAKGRCDDSVAIIKYVGGVLVR